MNSYERIFSVLTEGGKGMMDKRRVRRYRREQAEAPKNSPLGKKQRYRKLYQAKADRARAAYPEEPRPGEFRPSTRGA
tara:strand:+ start:6856 stop:7089 length:234 start_codon:yes stop_codon:yes gene_type:complete